MIVVGVTIVILLEIMLHTAVAGYVIWNEYRP